MRKVSALTVDDGDCSVQPHRSLSMMSKDSDGKHTLNTAASGQTETEAIVTPMSRSMSFPIEEEPGKAKADIGSPSEELPKGTEGTPSRSKVCNGSTKAREFSFPAALASEESDRRHRTRSMNANECLVEVEREILPFKREKQSLDGVQDDSTDESQRAVHITKRGMEVRGFIATTTKQRQLMRKLSGLGMEDPVFGDIAGQMNPEHASNIFDDMDLNDVPEDMRDMMTFVSDRTDAVDLDDEILDSPSSLKEDELGRRKQFASALRAMSNLHNSCSSLPPLGLDPRSLQMPDIASPRRSPVKKFHSRPPPPPPAQDTSIKLTKTNSKSAYEAPLPPSYTPQSGSFVRKKISKKPSCVDATHVVKRDERLAAKVNAMFQKSTSSLNFPSNTMDVCLSPTHVNVKCPRESRRRSMGAGCDSHEIVIPRRNDCRRMSACVSPSYATSNPPGARKNRRHSIGDGCDSYQVVNPRRNPGQRTSSVFVPPEMPSIGQSSSPFRDDERRTMPSMAALFPDVAGMAPLSGVPKTVMSPRRGSQGGTSTDRSRTPDRNGLPPSFSPPKPGMRSKKTTSNILPPTAGPTATRKQPKAAYCLKATRRDTASTKAMSPSSSLGNDAKWSYPENPAP